MCTLYFPAAIHSLATPEGSLLLLFWEMMLYQGIIIIHCICTICSMIMYTFSSSVRSINRYILCICTICSMIVYTFSSENTPLCKCNDNVLGTPEYRSGLYST